MQFETAVPIGKGAAGEVFKAWDPRLRKDVALKIFQRGDPESVARMLREARAQARVNHPNVCRVYDTGELDGRPWISMQLITGEPLDIAVDGLSLERKIALVRTIADAVQAAHAVGLIHRDLKPGNILVERREDGELVPVVLDFGIAREIRSPGLTMTGQVIGTPAYMSPEQARGEIRSLDRRSDVFSLGVLLYQLVAGRNPFAHTSMAQTLFNVTDEDPPALQKAAPGVPRELTAIVSKCMEKEPNRRYTSARALADDLDRFLAGEAVEARTAGWPHLLAKRLRRYPVASGFLALAAVSVLAAGGVSVQARLGAAEEARLAEQFGQRIERSETTLRLAHLSPLHDLSGERAMVAAEMAQIQAVMDRQPRSSAAGHYALGRSAASLGQLARAKRHLQAAWDAGYQRPRVALALGETLARLYMQALAQAESNRYPENRQALIVEARQSLAEPARKLLLTAGAEQPRDRAYLDALLAFADNDLERAVERGVASAAEVPWYYEGLLVAAEARLRQGLEAMGDGDHDATRRRFTQGRALIERALETAPGDPATHRTLCRAWQLEMRRRSDDKDFAFERARTACERALVADAGDLGALDELAEMGWRMGLSEIRGGGDGSELLALAESAATRALAIDKERYNPLLHLGNVEYARGRAANNRGDDPLSHYQAAAGFFQDAVDRAPGNALLLLSLGHNQLAMGPVLAVTGGDFGSAFEQAIAAYQRALVNPQGLETRLHNGIAFAYNDWGYYLMQSGKEPGEKFHEAIMAAEAALKIDPLYLPARSALAMAHWSQADWQRIHGTAAGDAYALAAAAFEAVLQADPDRATTQVNLANVLVDHADWALGAGLEADAMLDRSLIHLAAFEHIYPTDYLYVLPKLLLVRARLAEARGDDEAAAQALRRALEAINQLRAMQNPRVDTLALAARIHRTLATRGAATGDIPADHVQQGMQLVREALELDPDHPESLAEMAWLSSLAAQASPAVQTRQRHQTAARDAAARAAVLRPDLARQLVELVPDA